MRKNEFDKLLKAAVIQDAEEQGKLLSSDNAPIPEEAQARFSVALDRLMPIQQTESNAQRSGSASNRASRRWVGFAVGVPVLAATVLVAGLLLFGGGIKDEKMAEAAPEPMEPAYEPPTGAPLEVGDPEPTYEPEWPSEPISTSEPASTSEPVSTSAPLPEPGGSSFGPAFILNGKELDVYTEHYFIAGTDDDIPLNAFLSSIGSYCVDSPYNKYQVQCYEIEGIRYIYDWESQVFALAEQYDSVVQAAKTKGRMPTEAEFQAIDLLPAGVEMQAEAWLDHSTLESVLRKMGLDITIELDREENAIRVTLPEPEAAAVPDDPERPDLHLLAMKWEGYLCLYPETHQVFWSDERELDTGELVGLDELTYQKVAETEIVGTDLSVWNAEDYSTFADSNVGGGFSTADELEEVRRTEIVPGVTCLHLHHPTNEYYLSYAVLDYDGTDALFLIGVSYYDASGIDDFDSIVKRFFAMNPELALTTQADMTAEQTKTWSDNGIDGIGVVRGNSNGNLHRNRGRALCDGNDVYYVDQESDPVRICKYNLSTKEAQVLAELKDETSPMDIGYLNLIGTDLYYAEGIYIGQTQSIYRISTIDLRSEKIYEVQNYLFTFFAAYDRLFITDRQGILICDLNGKEMNRIDGYHLSGMMDGILYAYRLDVDGCYAIDLNGEVKDFYDTVEDPIPIDGHLVELNNLAGEPLEYKGILTIVNVVNHESRSFEVPEIRCAGYYNVSCGTIYLQRYGHDETGEIYRMDWNGNGLTKMDDRIFYTGVSLWGDTMLVDLVPCDELCQGDGSVDTLDALADEHDFEPSPFETGGYLRYVEEFSSDEILDPVSDTNDLVDQIESIWIGIYGEQITEQRPYQVFYDEKNGIWMVKGTLKENILGGVAYALIADGTWEVLAIWHTR